MSRIIGTIDIDFETGEDITAEQFIHFKNKLNKMMNDWEMEIDDIANQCGFEADDMHPIILDSIDYDY